MPFTRLPDPRLLSWTEWADTVILENPRAARTLSRRINEADEESWRDIADWITSDDPMTPRHDSFSDWREWAIYLMAVNPR